MAGAVQDVHARLDGLGELWVRLHGFWDEVVVVDASMVVACSGHCSAHASVQVNYPDRHLHTRFFTRAKSQPRRQLPLMMRGRRSTLVRAAGFAQPPFTTDAGRFGLSPACKPFKASFVVRRVSRGF